MVDVAGNYELLEELRSLGPSTFFRARNRMLGSEVMVRRLTLDPERREDARETFFREMRHAAGLRHPHIARPLDMFETDGFAWSVQEPRLGQPSSERVEAQGVLSVVDATEWGSRVGDALAYLHGRGFVSGRVSPRWILLDSEGPVLVAFTKSADLAAGLWPLRPAVAGLSPFSAPEELLGERTTPRSDLWSLAATVAWWLTREHPCGGASPEEAMARVRGGAPAVDVAALRHDVPEEVARALGSALRHVPAEREGSAASLSAVLGDTHRRLVAEIPRGFAQGTRLSIPGPEPEEVEVIARHGSGSFGVVLRARSADGQRTFAVKTLKPEHQGNAEVRERFVRESRVLHGIGHRNVVRVFAVGEQGGAPFVVMEFVEGPDLATVVLREGALRSARAARIVAGIARGLGAIHAQGIVHRDLKPHNVLLGPGDRPVIADFGLAKDLASTRMTLTGAVVGTPAYMAPEQVSGSDASFAADLYALGTLAYELLTGRPPFAGRETISLMRAIVTEAPPPLPAEVPAPFRDVVAALLAKEPSARPARPDDVACALDAAACDMPCEEDPLADCAAGPETARPSPTYS